MPYPASSYPEGVDLTIIAGNQLHQVINGEANEVVSTTSGDIPSVRKALADSMMFKVPIDWVQGEVTTDPLETRLYNGQPYWAPEATLANPITLGASPVATTDWLLAPQGYRNEYNLGKYQAGILISDIQEYVVYNGKSYFAVSPPYTTTSTTPDNDTNMFEGDYTTIKSSAEVFSNTNLLSNSNFLTPSPDAITHPNATPESYVAGTQIFSGVYAGDSGCMITFIDGRVNCIAGDYQFKLPNTGGLERVPVFTSSVSDYDGIPKTTGVSHALVADEYVVTVTPAAGDVFSVKLEQGSVATGHDVQSYRGQDYTFNSVAEMVEGAPVGVRCSSGGNEWVRVSSASGDLSDFEIKNRIVLYPRDFGILANGSDETDKWQGLIAYASSIKAGIGDWIGDSLISSPLVPTSGFAGFLCNNEIYNVLTKGFDGDIIESRSQAAVYNGFQIKGNATNFTGGGVYAISDDVYFGKSLRITDTEDSPIIFQGGEAAYNTVDGSFLLSADNSSHSVRGDGFDISTSPTVRRFVGIRGGGLLPDFTGMNRATCVECFGGAPKFGSSSGKIGFHNNRVTTGDDFIIEGLDHNFTGNQIGLAAGTEARIADGAAGITFDSSNRITRAGSTNISIIDDNPYGGQTTNNITTVLENVESFIEWKGSITDGDIGDSSVTAYLKRTHRQALFSFTMVRGSASTLPDGNWSITLPFNAAVTAIGSCLIKPSGGGAFAAGAVIVQGGGNLAQFHMHGQTDLVNKTTYSFGAGAQLNFSIEFIMQ